MINGVPTLLHTDNVMHKVPCTLFNRICTASSDGEKEKECITRALQQWHPRELELVIYANPRHNEQGSIPPLHLSTIWDHLRILNPCTWDS